jgi:coenzyme F420-dependent glucose-6-phosphate dehydrogenase
MELGYALSSEEHRPNDLVRHAEAAEAAGFSFALISDHYHPWVDRQGQSPFVWCTIGGIAQRTSRLRLGTGVTCPIMRIHPAVVAQAAATAAAMMPGRFFLGLGSGENLNEHITGEHWPNAPIRLEMLDEAVEIIRMLWRGGEQSHYGAYFTVEEARVYTLPDELPPIYIAASGERAATLAAEAGDGIISTAPERALVERFEADGGAQKPRYGQITVCYADDEATARRTAHEWWPNAALHGDLSAEIKTPALFQDAAKSVRADDVSETIICGPDVDQHLQAIREFADAGFDHVYVHQVGPDQSGFFRFYERRIIPEIR